MTTTTLRRTSRFAKVAVAVGSLLALSACDLSFQSLPLPGGADLGDDPYSVTVEFRDVLDLVEQSSVKVNDVSVGRVDEITLDGYTAEVVVLIRGDVELPANAIAEIRQTSLLGEKFVSLSAPTSGASAERLGEGDLITLERSGRNTEIEEVFGALSLVLNGGGIAQLKTIAAELNTAFEGREGVTKSTLRRIAEFMGQLDDNKDDIVEALDRVDALARSLNQQEGTLDVALDNLPAALASIDRQRDDLVEVLAALADLSDVGTDVIAQSKASTIRSLNSLAPILRELARAGDDLPQSLQVVLTYPFVDAVVGQNAQQALNRHIGDYTNLSAQLELDLRGGLPPVPGLPGGLSLPEFYQTCATTPLNPVCDLLEGVTGGGGGGGGNDGGGGGGDGGQVGGPLCTLPLPVLCRTAPTFDGASTAPGASAPSGLRTASAGDSADPELGAMLTWGLVER